MKMKNKKWSLEAKRRASRTFRLRNNYVFNTNFNMERPKILNIIEKRPKIAKNVFLENFGKIWKSIQFGKLNQKSLFLHCFL